MYERQTGPSTWKREARAIWRQGDGRLDLLTTAIYLFLSLKRRRALCGENFVDGQTRAR